MRSPCVEAGAGRGWRFGKWVCGADVGVNEWERRERNWWEMWGVVNWNTYNVTKHYTEIRIHFKSLWNAGLGFFECKCMERLNPMEFRDESGSHAWWNILFLLLRSLKHHGCQHFNSFIVIPIHIHYFNQLQCAYSVFPSLSVSPLSTEFKMYTPKSCWTCFAFINLRCIILSKASWYSSFHIQSCSYS